ncbi:MAG: type IV toxin-antitoxin system AbiEi family antitoxin [Accumulibacter sp.]|jgi:hypothetical protein|uniref:type IV toxin-antitoxin system AbiEi family antitoxin n=1 Tax=Accumulibacter sp. TaxID=2053492 RepID=UPI002FC2AED4
MKTADAGVVLDRTVQALRAHSLVVAVQADHAAQTDGHARTWLRVARGRGSSDYSVVVKGRLTQSSLGAVLAQLRQPVDAGQPPALLVTDHVSPPLAERLQASQQQFADAAGNAYLETPSFLVLVKGRKPDAKEIALRASRGFSNSRLKVLFALICDPQLAAAPYRTIAAAANVALGSLPAVLADLQRDESLLVQQRQRRLNASKRLLDEWAQAYAVGLRGRTLSARHVAGNFARWPEWPLPSASLRWGGEPAAKLLGCSLQPGILTLYGDRLPARLVTLGHLVPAGPADYQGLLELRKPFWGEALAAATGPQTVPPALVYADLLATGNGHCCEAAQAVYESFLARAFPSR